VCSWNERFARHVAHESPFQPRAEIAGKDAGQLARELLEMSQEEFSAAFKNSPMKRAKLRDLKRNAAVSMGNVGTASDVRTLAFALGDPEPLVRAHVAWALGRIGSPAAIGPLRTRLVGGRGHFGVRGATRRARRPWRLTRAPTYRRRRRSRR
jgi:epoxyqueuosine reductase